MSAEDSETQARDLLCRYTGAIVLGACLAAFIAACLSDPGIITAGTHAKHAALYAYSGVVSQDGQHCSVCMWKRPARSKHCNITNRYLVADSSFCIGGSL